VFDLPAALATLPPGCLSNLAFVEGEIDVLAEHVTSATVVLALHGCNEANKARLGGSGLKCRV
jgi:hypothetical protein